MDPKGYTTKEDIENYLGQDIDESFDAQLESWMAGIESIIERVTGRIFIADTEATARLFDGDGTSVLLIPDCVEVTTVEVGNDPYGGAFSEVAATGSDRYFVDPPRYTGQTLPIRKITLGTQGFLCGKQNNRITAKWGYSVEVPADVRFAATVFMAGILNQQRQGGDEIKTEKIGNYSVTYNTDKDNNSWADFSRAQEILAGYTKLNI